MESTAALAIIKALQIPITLLATLNLDGFMFPSEKTIENNTRFDHIIIGGGTAGCILANRLSEDNSTSVLLLEAGENPPISSFFPPLFAVFPQSKYDWNFTSTFDPYAASSQNNYTKLTSGKVLGGTSTINHFIKNRGSPLDYDKWAEILGDERWTYENVLPYFKKLEKLEDSEILDSEYKEYHGLDGLSATSRLAKSDADIYIQSFNESGNRVPLDLNGDVALGYVQSLFTTSKNGIRQSTAYSHLTPIKDRENLYVKRNAFVTRIIFEGNKAVAIEAVIDDETYVFKANKEIIVCAGVYNSPKLLQLSGVGPKDHLESLNIPVVADLPVGDNYKDQVAVSIAYRTSLSIALINLYSIELNNVPFPVLSGLKALDSEQLYADYFTFSLLLSHDTPFFILACAVVFQFRPEICDKYNNQLILHNSMYAVLGKTQPNSCGNIRLNSRDPFEKPLITTGYFTNKTDLDDMVKYVKDFIKVGDSSYFKKVGAKLLDPELDQCANYTFNTDEYWYCFVLNSAGSVYHASSTCAMGPVLDSEFRVHNVTNLRVVDSSSMPDMVNGGPHEVVMMLAEKAADLIRNVTTV